VGWIGLAQDRDKWRALLNAVMNLWAPSYAGKLYNGCKLVRSRVVSSLLESVRTSFYEVQRMQT
jgi:hypothetical protein